MKSKLFGLFPVILAALFGMVLSQLTLNDSPVTGQVFDEVSIGQVPAYIPAEEGAGYKPQTEVSQDCNCDNCCDEAKVREIVRDELSKQRSMVVATKPVTVQQPKVSSSVVTYSTPTVTTVQSAPIVVRQGIFGRRVYRQQSSGVCRIVNGRMVCN